MSQPTGSLPDPNGFTRYLDTVVKGISGTVSHVADTLTASANRTQQSLLPLAGAIDNIGRISTTMGTIGLALDPGNRRARRMLQKGVDTQTRAQNFRSRVKTNIRHSKRRKETFTDQEELDTAQLLDAKALLAKEEDERKARSQAASRRKKKKRKTKQGSNKPHSSYRRR